MGSCCTTEASSQFYIDFANSQLIRQTNNSKFVYSYKKIVENLQYPSILTLNEDRIFFIGGKVLNIPQTLCFQMIISKKSIIQYSSFEKSSYKGFSFINEDYLYYIFAKTPNKDERPFLRLSLTSNQWEQLDIDSPNKGPQEFSLSDLKDPGFAYTRNALYIIGGSIPCVRADSKTIFRLEFPSMNITNLKVDLKQTLYKPLAFFLYETLFIILQNDKITQKLIQFDKNFNMKRSDLFGNTKKIKTFTPILWGSNEELVINTDIVETFNFRGNSLDALVKIVGNGQEIRLVVQKNENNSMKTGLKCPMMLKFFEEFKESEESSGHDIIPVVFVPDGKKVYEDPSPAPEKSIREGGDSTINYSIPEKKSPFLLPKEYYPPEDYKARNYKNHLANHSSEEEDGFHQRSPMEDQPLCDP